MQPRARQRPRRRRRDGTARPARARRADDGHELTAASSWPRAARARCRRQYTTIKFRQRRLRGGRGGDQDGAPVPPPEPAIREVQGALALPRLSRRARATRWRRAAGARAGSPVRAARGRASSTSTRPTPYRPPLRRRSGGGRRDATLRLVEEAIELEGPETIAALITEPILMSAGVVVPPDGYLPALRDLCDRHDIVLIFDEIITGFGRTGHLFASELFATWPDILVFGKGRDRRLRRALGNGAHGSPGAGVLGSTGAASSRPAIRTPATPSPARRGSRRSRSCENATWWQTPPLVASRGCGGCDRCRRASRESATSRTGSPVRPRVRARPRDEGAVPRGRERRRQGAGGRQEQGPAPAREPLDGGPRAAADDHGGGARRAARHLRGGGDRGRRPSESATPQPVRM